MKRNSGLVSVTVAALAIGAASVQSAPVTIAGKPRYKLASVDHFTLNAAGEFIRMVAFARPSAAAK
jgi:hypothetical protein